MSSKKAEAKQDAPKGQEDELIKLAYQNAGKLDSLLAQMNNFYDESEKDSNSKPLAERLRRADQDRRYTERDILDTANAIKNALKSMQDVIECDLTAAKARNERLREENLQLRLQVEALTSAQNDEPREWRDYVDRKLDRLLDAVSDVTRLVDSTGKAGSYDPSLLNR